MMDFFRVEAEFAQLKAQFESGDLREEEFKAQLEALMIEDEQGRWWILGYETGQWYVHDGERWVQQQPPRAAPGAPPAHSLHPGAADLTPDTQPGRVSAAPSRPAPGLKQGSDGVSVLLITAGWIICWGGADWACGTYFDLEGYLAPEVVLLVFTIAGGIGGLITGLVLRRTDPPISWKQVPVVTLGWAIGWAIARAISPSWMTWGLIGGLVGGLITALALKWTHPSIRWKHVAVVTLGWGIGWAVGGAIASSIDTLDYVVRFVLWGGIAGTVGSWVTFWQLREARQHSP